MKRKATAFKEYGIEEQIEYLKNLRKNVIPYCKLLQSEMPMIFSIEQSLIAAKWQLRTIKLE